MEVFQLKGRTWLKILALVSVIMLAACGSPSSSSGSNNAQATGSQASAAGKEPILIGGTLPLSGGAALDGEMARQGIDLAVDMINAKGGIVGGRPVKFIPYDDRAVPEEGVSAVKRLLDQDKVKAIIGTVNSGVALAQIPVTKQRGVLQIVVLAVHPDITKQGDPYLFRTATPPTIVAPLFGDFISKRHKTIAVLAEDDAYGRSEIGNVKPVWDKAGQPKIAFEGFFDVNATDFTTQLTKIKSQNPEALVCYGQVGPCALIFKQARQLGVKWQFYSAAPTLNPVMVEQGGSAVDQLISFDSWDPSNPSESNQTLVTQFKKKYGKMPSTYAVMSFEGMYRLLLAMDKAGTADDAAKIAQVYRTLDWEAPRGKYQFSDTGEAGANPFPVIYKDGKIQQFK